MSAASDGDQSLDGRPPTLPRTPGRIVLAVQIVLCSLYAMALSGIGVWAPLIFLSLATGHGIAYALSGPYREWLYNLGLTIPGLLRRLKLLLAAAGRGWEYVLDHPIILLYGLLAAGALVAGWITGLISPVILLVIDGLLFPYGRVRLDRSRTGLALEHAQDGSEPDWDAIRRAGPDVFVLRAQADGAGGMESAVERARAELPGVELLVAGLESDAPPAFSGVAYASPWPDDIERRIADHSLPVVGLECAAAELGPEAPGLRGVGSLDRLRLFVEPGVEPGLYSRGYALRVRRRMRRMARRLRGIHIRRYVRIRAGRRGGFSRAAMAGMERTLAGLRRHMVENGVGAAFDVTGWGGDEWERLAEVFGVAAGRPLECAGCCEPSAGSA